MMVGAIAKISAVGSIKIRIYTFGHAMLSTVQNTPKNAAVSKESRSVSLMRPPFPAPKFVEMSGWAACPTL